MIGNIRIKQVTIKIFNHLLVGDMLWYEIFIPEYLAQSKSFKVMALVGM